MFFAISCKSKHIHNSPVWSCIYRYSRWGRFFQHYFPWSDLDHSFAVCFQINPINTSLTMIKKYELDWTRFDAWNWITVITIFGQMKRTRKKQILFHDIAMDDACVITFAFNSVRYESQGLHSAHLWNALHNSMEIYEMSTAYKCF